MIKITEQALKKITQMSEKNNKNIIRVGVQGGSCAGYSYFLDFVDEIKDTDIIFEFGIIKVICDPKSLKLIDESEIYYDTNLLNGGLKFSNPNSKKTCSCGDSFSV